MKTLFLSIVILFAQCASPQGKQPNNQTEADNHPGAKNIILMIGDGMGLSQMYSGLTANKGSLNVERCTFIGLSKTQSADNYVTDSAAGGTAIACGRKTNNGVIGLDADSTHLKSVLEYSAENGLSTGIVVSCDLTHATPASFIAHQVSRNMLEEIAADYLKTDITVFIGGGRLCFENRKDNLNLTDSLRAKGYQIAYNMDEVAGITSGKLAALVADVHPAPYPGRGDMLPQSVQKALDLMSNNENGFFLMVEGSQIDWEGHSNNTEGIINEMLDFDNAIKVALDFAESNPGTLVIITADHETGGMGLNSGDMTTGDLTAGYTTKMHTAIPVPVYAFGAGAQDFAGIYHNTEIFNKCMNLLGFGR